MQSFRIGDSVRILPRYAHLYPRDSGVIVAIRQDPIRQFNKYTVRFSDGSTAHLFEFQLGEVIGMNESPGFFR